eukprot:CAMPEP_0184645286 /NCGR_PEP_ID=MMETSP0308-20130426/1778_1 /TAXON_ID=38269 /ORGANISM="Gloeochaete witrockiana, Strain SAG 46.84" /LENGTH=98 /DNA_ID=CAMNT_0027074179 /DNA_START=181 /DNA_END=477 /DNA_ORIENTATION=+
MATVMELRSRLRGKRAFKSNPTCEISQEIIRAEGSATVEVLYVDDTTLTIDAAGKNIEALVKQINSESDRIARQQDTTVYDPVIMVKTYADMMNYVHK